MVERPGNSACGVEPRKRQDNDGYNYDRSCGFHVLFAALQFTLLVPVG